jgi:acetoacetate decarboxylase
VTQASYFMSQDAWKTFMHDSAMNSLYGMQLFGITDPRKAKEMLPPPLELVDEEEPVFHAYIVNIRQPTFAPWYMEGGIGVMAKLGESVGLYFFGLQLTGPGALMGAFSGRETAGLPKKIGDRISVERLGNHGHCFIERGGVRLLDVRLEIGEYNDESFSQPQEGCSVEKPIVTEGGSLLHRYHFSGAGLEGMEVIQYDSPTRFYSWEPASATVTLKSSFDDPWGDLPVVKVLGAGWMVSDNWVSSIQTLDRLDDTQAAEAMRHLFAGRYDQSTLGPEHQRYQA